MSKFVSVSARLATPDDAHLPAYDNTKLVAVNTCPTWGLIRYVKHKTYEQTARAMALEAGGAMHEVFAAVRLWQLRYHTLKDNPLAEQFWEYNGQRLFRIAGDDEEEQLSRWNNMKDQLAERASEDERTRCITFCLSALYSSGFYDDPSDKRRTLTNLEEAALLYIDRYDFDRMPIWIRDSDDPTSDVGIEIAFDIVLTFVMNDGEVKEYRFVGKLDGIHTRNAKVTICENKTASRLDEAWQNSFELASQVTGYCVSTSVFTNEPCANAYVLGLQIPLPRSVDIGGRVELPVNKESHHFARWFDWFLHTVELVEEYENDLLNAPMYTHSCNRYFRSCSLIPYCYSSDEDRREHLSEMIEQEWSPLHSVEGKAGD